VIYEALAEGGITRFLALYLTDDAPMVGPVRSGRHYFVSWAREYEAALVQVGSSPQGFSALYQLGMPSVDEGRRAAGFWRSRTRLAPHNAYASTEVIRASLDPAETTAGWGGLRFKQPEARYSGEPAETFTIEYGWNYRVAYRYDEADNSYLRSVLGLPHRDAQTGEQLRASSVVVLEMPAWVMDSVGRLDMSLVGEGRASYFLDGVRLSGSWRRASEWAPTEFVDEDGDSIAFTPGTVWIHVVSPQWSRVSY
jgi:hypothetical protein